MERSKHLGWITIGTVSYILLALCWWSILLIQKNQAHYQAQVQIRQLLDDPEKAETLIFPDRATIDEVHQRQRNMILGEMVFILASVLLGIGLIFRGYRKEHLINRQKRNFLLSITHELKSPLAAIRLALETIQRPKLPSDKIMQLSRSAVRQTDRLQDTMDNLLLAARMDQGYTPQRDLASLREQVQIWQEAFQTQWPDHPLTVHLHPATPDHITLDWTGLATLFRNLTENAAKYSSPDQPISVAFHHSQNMLVLTVTDQGRGIPAHEKSRIFDMFYRIGDEETRQTTGSGLGLYLARIIALENRGRITVQDHHPSGTIFTVHLPFIS